jgi:hypothetical protein
MRGTIIMWSGEKGEVSAGAKRHDFDIQLWKGATAPSANMTVELAHSEGGTLTGVAPLSEADLAKEKLAQGSQAAKAILQDVGRDITIAYAVSVIGALFFSVVSASGMFSGVSIALANLLSGKLGLGELMGGGSGKGTFLVLLATAMIAVPYFWKHMNTRNFS